MNNLPQSPSGNDTSSTTPASNQQPTVAPVAPSGLAKELEAGGVAAVEAGLRPAAPEVELPREVAAAGVKLQPTTIQLPPKVKQLGLKSVGDTTTAPAAPAVALPLTDDQIVTGLHASLTSSLRWLAEWCLRRLKQIHQAMRFIHGKVIRVNR